MSVSGLAAARPRGDNYAELFNQHAGRLLATVRGTVCTSPENVEDACGFAWLQLVRHRPCLSTAFAWLCTTAIREAMKLHRGSFEDGRLDEVADVILDTSHDLDRRVDLIAAGQAIRQAALGRREARLVGLRVAGYSHKEMATETGDSARTVDRQIARAQRKLRAAGGRSERGDWPVLTGAPQN